MRTFSSHNSRFTDCMAGRTIEYAYRADGKFVIRAADGHEAVLEIVDGEIAMTKVDVHIFVAGMTTAAMPGVIR